jgi:hypothetical protein
MALVDAETYEDQPDPVELTTIINRARMQGCTCESRDVTVTRLRATGAAVGWTINHTGDCRTLWTQNARWN